MATSADSRLAVPVGTEGDLLVFHRSEIYGLTGWSVLWSGTTPYLFDRQTDAMTRLRFGKVDDSKDAALVVAELYVSWGPRRVSSRALRENIALSRFEAAVNVPAVRDRLAPELPRSDMVSVPWPEDWSSPGDSGRPWWVVPPQTAELLEAPRKPRLKLKVPKGYGRPDSFYRDVADRYAYLTTVSNRPANELAEANEVPVTTVHGWVKEARKRGFLPAQGRRKGER